MTVERTLAIVKPDAVGARQIGEVIKRLEGAGFEILGMKMVRLNPRTAGEFYAVHKERPFYGSLVEFMTSDRVVAMALSRENAVAYLREVIGATDPKEAEPGTIRADLAESKERNVIHASDSTENAKIELSFFFNQNELLMNESL